MSKDEFVRLYSLELSNVRERYFSDLDFSSFMDIIYFSLFNEKISNKEIEHLAEKHSIESSRIKDIHSMVTGEDDIDFNFLEDIVRRSNKVESIRVQELVNLSKKPIEKSNFLNKFSFEDLLSDKAIESLGEFMKDNFFTFKVKGIIKNIKKKVSSFKDYSIVSLKIKDIDMENSYLSEYFEYKRCYVKVKHPFVKIRDLRSFKSVANINLDHVEIEGF